MIFNKNAMPHIALDRFDTKNRPINKIRSRMLHTDITSRRIREMTDEIECTYLYQCAEFLDTPQRL